MAPAFRIKKALRLPKLTSEVTAMVEQAGALRLMPAIAKLEGLPEVTLDSLRHIGLGSPTGVRLSEIQDPATAASERQSYVTAAS